MISIRMQQDLLDVEASGLSERSSGPIGTRFCFTENCLVASSNRQQLIYVFR
jgi:hypothetical protein